MTLYIYDKNEIKLVRTLEGVLTDRDTIKTDGGETIVLGDGLGVSFGDTFAADEREKALTPMPSVSERVEILEQMVTEMLFGGVYGQI